MTALQTRTYWREWSFCRAALLKLGRAKDQAYAERHLIHKKALGYSKSSKDLTNPEFDKILAAFRAFSRPDDLRAQLRQQDQPEIRMRALLNRLGDLAAKVVTPGGDQGHTNLRAARYLEGLAGKVCNKELNNCSEAEVAKLIGILSVQINRREARKQRAEANRIADADRPENVPF